MNMTVQLQTPSVLAFESKLASSDAIMGASRWEERSEAKWQDVMVTEKSVRGTISNRMKTGIANDPAKVDAEVQKANLQTVDNAALPFDADTLRVGFTVRILGELSIPSTCNDPAYQSALVELIEGYIGEHSFIELAKRYAVNIANGRFLWRNRVGAEQVEVQVVCGGKKWCFNAQEIGLHSFDHSLQDLNDLASTIATGLKGDENVLLEVTAYVQLGNGQTVFPSQELVMDKGTKSKYLYQLNGVAAMHSQKIGNALRTIDTWYGNADEVGPIAVEPYGSVTNRGKAYRQPKEKNDFYTLLDDWILKGRKPAVEQQHYIIAMFIRGGVFGK
jgi:CRISPR-associated protein Csy3